MGFGTSINESLSNLAYLRIIFDAVGAGGFFLTTAGLLTLPKVGFGRAIKLGFGSLLPASFTKSVRTREIAELKSSLKYLSDGRYIVVTGGKGIGKSCLINTSVDFTFGVVKVDLKSDDDMHVIVWKVMREITNIRFLSVDFDLTGITRRVLFFYRLFFRSNPAVVISVPEHQVGKKYLHITAAVRNLADNFHLRVIVDSSTYSNPPGLMSTIRESVLSVDFMEKNVVESIPELKELIDFLKCNKLDQVVYNVIGGSPSEYINLRDVFEFTTGTTEMKILSIKEHIKFVLIDALYNKIGEASPNTEKIIALFRQTGKLATPKMELNTNGILLDYPNTVFRQVTTDSRYTIEPATPAVGLIIEHSIIDENDVGKYVDNLFE